MIVDHQTPGGSAIFCDDIRDEIAGKQTLVGTYAGEMTVYGIAPIRLPLLCVVVRYFEDPAALPKKVRFLISKDEKDQSDVLADATLDIPAVPDEFEFPDLGFVNDTNTHIAQIQFAARMPDIVFTNDCRIRVRALSGDDDVRIGVLMVKLAPPPIVPTQPVQAAS